MDAHLKFVYDLLEDTFHTFYPKDERKKKTFLPVQREKKARKILFCFMQPTMR